MAHSVEQMGRKGKILLDWAVASRPEPGQEVSGDLSLAKAFPEGTLAAVVDGLGAGDEAALAAKTAATTLQRFGREALTGLVKRCDRNLMMTRGAALTLAWFSALEPRLSWLGVGNVEAWLLRANPAAKPAQERLRLYEGVVGYHVPVVQESSLPLESGDTLLLATDGVWNDFAYGLDLQKPPQVLAEEILGTYYKGTDDALVLVARYCGL